MQTFTLTRNAFSGMMKIELVRNLDDTLVTGLPAAAAELSALCPLVDTNAVAKSRFAASGRGFVTISALKDSGRYESSNFKRRALYFTKERSSREKFRDQMRMGKLRS